MDKILLIITIFTLPVFSIFGQKAKDGNRYKEIVYDNNYDHNKWGISPEDSIFKFRAYTTSFDGEDDNNDDGQSDKWGVPEWVAFEVHKKTSKIKVNRPSTWMSEESLYDPGVNIAPKHNTYHFANTTKAVFPYSLTYNLSRGHMCPKNVANRLGENADYNTHTVLNACPQYQWFNNGIWKDLERLTENWADEYEKLWIICGPIIHNNEYSCTRCIL
jgi:DNA/RNA endonuclease G (NUC1)